MADYRLYFHNAAGHIVRVLELDCLDDTHAITLATHHADGASSELWHLDRKIHAYDGAPRRP